MADYPGMDVAAYMLSFILIRRLEALTRFEAEKLIHKRHPSGTTPTRAGSCTRTINS